MPILIYSIFKFSTAVLAVGKGKHALNTTTNYTTFASKIKDLK